MENANPLTTPFDTHMLFSVEVRLKGEEVQFPYKEVVGSLMYAIMMTQLDITYSFSMVARYSEKPKNLH
jgi:hypothetical protein